MAQNQPNLGHFYVISGHFAPKSPKNHKAGYIDLPILAAAILIHLAYQTNNLQN